MRRAMDLVHYVVKEGVLDYSACLNDDHAPSMPRQVRLSSSSYSFSFALFTLEILPLNLKLFLIIL